MFNINIQDRGHVICWIASLMAQLFGCKETLSTAARHVILRRAKIYLLKVDKTVFT